MITLTIETPGGATRDISVKPEGSLMEAIRDNGFDDLLAACGGFCSCATCHIIVATGSSALAAMSSDEDALLDGSSYREESSRLSCQIPLSGELDGLKLRIAPRD